MVTDGVPLRCADEHRTVRRPPSQRPQRRAPLVRAVVRRALGFPNETEVVWTGCRPRVGLHRGGTPAAPATGSVTLFVEDLDAAVAEIGARGLEPAERETYSNGVTKVTYRDDEGNEIGFGGMQAEET